jgi:hypothetical protein
LANFHRVSDNLLDGVLRPMLWIRASAYRIPSAFGSRAVEDCSGVEGEMGMGDGGKGITLPVGI